MQRYHRKIYFPEKYINHLYNITTIINDLEWRYTSHCIDRIKTRADLEGVLNFVKNIILYPEQVFEFYTDDFNFITKICYRVPYNKDIDLILVIGEGKKLITVYYNANSDEHFTLQKEIYTKG